MELKLTSVARASLEELRLDYEDFLRQRGLHQWEREDPRRAELIDRRCAAVDEVAHAVGKRNSCERWTEWTRWTGWTVNKVYNVHSVRQANLPGNCR